MSSHPFGWGLLPTPGKKGAGGGVGAWASTDLFGGHEHVGHIGLLAHHRDVRDNIDRRDIARDDHHPTDRRRVGE